MSDLQVGVVVKVKRIEGYDFVFPYFDPSGKEGTVVAYDHAFPEVPWVVEIIDEPDGTPDGIARLYPELYAERELEVVN